jgi:hypothetical protein
MNYNYLQIRKKGFASCKVSNVMTQQRDVGPIDTQKSRCIRWPQTPLSINRDRAQPLARQHDHQEVSDGELASTVSCCGYALSRLIERGVCCHLMQRDFCVSIGPTSLCWVMTLLTLHEANPFFLICK